MRVSHEATRPHMQVFFLRINMFLSYPSPSVPRYKVVNTGDGRPGGGGLTVSVNTNWFNGFNLERVHAFLRSELDAVRLALDHLRDSWSEGLGGQGGEGGGEGGGRGWERQCELVMRANSALSLTEFARMVMARAQLLLGNEVAAADAAAADDDGKSRSIRGGDHVAETSPRNSGDSCRRSGERRGERWTIIALDQVLAVLRELSVFPCIDHIFLEEDDDGGDDQGDDTHSQISSIGAPEEMRTAGDAGGAGTACSLRETLEAVEAYLRDRCHSKSSRLPTEA